MNKAIEALEDAYGAVFAAARVGMTADEIDAILSERLRTHGTDLPPDRVETTPFVVEEGGIGPKLRRNRAPLEEGKLWGMDNSICVDGRWADLGRYGWFGRVPSDLAEAHGRLPARQDEIAAAIRPGVGMGEIYRSLGPGPAFEMHRIDTEPSMLPFCGDLMAQVREQMARSVAQGLVLEVGQSICIELWDGLAGGIEDMYRVEAHGAVRISTLPRQIRAIG